MNFLIRRICSGKNKRAWRLSRVYMVALLLCLAGNGAVYGAETEVHDIIGAVGYNARTIALGGCLGAITSDVDTIFLNPAGIGRFRSQEINITYNRWTNGMSYESIGYITPLNGMTLGLSAIYQNPLGVNPELGNLNSRNLALSMSAGKKIDDSIMLGVNVKAMQEETDGNVGNSVVVDMAGLYNIGIVGITMGFGIQNIGSRIKEMTNGGELPLNLNMGGTYSTLEDSMFIGLDLNVIDDGVLVNSGIEFIPVSVISFRAGYRALLTPGGSFSTFNRFSAGVGVNVFKLHMDYAYVSDGVGSIDHIFSMRFKVLMEPFGAKSSPQKYTSRVKSGKKRSCITIDGVTMCLYND